MFWLLFLLLADTNFSNTKKQNQEQNEAEETKQVVTVNSPATPKEVIGTKLKDFNLFDVDGQQRQISEWQGKTLVLNFLGNMVCTMSERKYLLFV